MPGIHGENQTDDFEVVIRIRTAEEGGRATSVCNGIRWDLSYTGGDDLFCVWPDFKGYDSTTPLPRGQDLPATLVILSHEMRPYHRWMMREGTTFYMREGRRIVAEGTTLKRLDILRFDLREPTLRDYGLPPECVSFIESGRQFQYVASDCECGMVRLVRPDEIFACEVSCESDVSRGWFRNPQRIRGSIRAVNLLAETDGYDPEFILSWLPDFKQFATIDTSHDRVTLFPTSSWADIVADPLSYLQSQWSIEEPPWSVRLDVRTLPNFHPVP